MINAYDDHENVFRSFHLNGLKRINDELGGHFNIDDFEFYPCYNPETGNARGYLVSKKAQSVYIKALELNIHFEAWETIFTAIAKKYSIQEIENLALKSGFQVVKHFFDSQQYFVDTIWQKS